MGVVIEIATQSAYQIYAKEEAMGKMSLINQRAY
jgi:hypothetical protein